MTLISTVERNKIAKEQIRNHSAYRLENDRHPQEAISRQPRYESEDRLTRKEAERLLNLGYLKGGFYLPQNFPCYHTSNQWGGGLDMHIVMSDREAEVLEMVETLMNRVHYSDVPDMDPQFIVNELQSIAKAILAPGPHFKD